jgi:hypothetical protein
MKLSARYSFNREYYSAAAEIPIPFDHAITLIGDV